MTGVGTSTPRLAFVGHGTTAPAAMPPGEVWLDVGGRLEPPVFDHHRGGPGVESTMAAVAAHADWLRAALPPDNAALRLVLHVRPDLDAVGAVWVVVNRCRLGAMAAFIDEVTAAVTRHDQGHVLDRDPLADLGVVYAMATAGARDDVAMVVQGVAFLDRIGAARSGSATLGEAVRRAAPPGVADRLAKEAAAFRGDLAAAPALHLALPDAAGNRYGCVMRHFVAPACTMPKVFARRLEPGGPEAFPAMVVSTPAGKAPEGTPLWRHVVSTDPTSGLTLAGLGAALEAAEQAAEDGPPAKPVLPGRERVAEGSGRFGGTIMSPWYDGRGHGHTIIDSPAVGTGADRRIASRLPPHDVSRILRDLFGSG